MDLQKTVSVKRALVMHEAALHLAVVFAVPGWQGQVGSSPLCKVGGSTNVLKAV